MNCHLFMGLSWPLKNEIKPSLTLCDEIVRNIDVSAYETQMGHFGRILLF